MNITPKQVLTLAAKYIGYKEKASDKDLYSFEDNAGRGNFTMFQAELDKAKFWNTPKNGYEWCTSFTEDMLRTVIYNKRMIEKMLEK